MFPIDVNAARIQVYRDQRMANGGFVLSILVT